jgi:hypothetical protein
MLDMLKTSTDYLIGKYSTLRKELNKDTKKKFICFLKKINYEFGCHDIDDVEFDDINTTSEYIKNILKNTKLLLYNKRGLIKDENAITMP